jgi:hypothetical protein
VLGDDAKRPQSSKRVTGGTPTQTDGGPGVPGRVETDAPAARDFLHCRAAVRGHAPRPRPGYLKAWPRAHQCARASRWAARTARTASFQFRAKARRQTIGRQLNAERCSRAAFASPAIACVTVPIEVAAAHRWSHRFDDALKTSLRCRTNCRAWQQTLRGGNKVRRKRPPHQRSQRRRRMSSTCATPTPPSDPAAT